MVNNFLNTQKKSIMKTDEKAMNPVEAMSIEERNKNLIRRSTEEIYNKGNYADIDKVVSSGFIIHSLNPEREIRGAEGAKNFVRALRTAFPDLKFTITDQFAEGEKVVTHYIVEGTHKGLFEGIPPTGKSFKVSAIDIDYITNGKVSECWSNLDELSLLRQLGVLSKPF